MIEDILTSSAKLKCLRVLEASHFPLHLRRIANLTGLAPRSVQLALKSLKEHEVLTSEKIKNREFYQLNQDSICYPYIAEIIYRLQSVAIKKRSEEYHSLDNSVNFIESATGLIEQIKKDNEFS